MNITTLDISGNPGLERLFCSETGISALDISNSPALRSLDFTDSKLNVAAVRALFKSLSSRNGD